MIIDLNALPAGGRRFAGTLALDLGSLSGGEPLGRRAVTFGLWAILDGDDLYVRGWASSRVVTKCSRCLRPTPLGLQREFEVVYRPARYRPTDDERELDADDLDIDYYRGDTIDLTPLLTEQIILALPMKPLCRDDCEGLCAQCGTDLNESSCDCEPPVDPRLAALQALRDRL